MITSALLTFLGYILYGALLILPTASPNATLFSSLGWIYEQAYSLNWLVPVDTMLQAFGKHQAQITFLFYYMFVDQTTSYTLVLFSK